MFVRLIFSLLILLSANAYGGGVGESMKNFWNGSGGINNFNGPSAYEVSSQ